MNSKDCLKYCVHYCRLLGFLQFPDICVKYGLIFCLMGHVVYSKVYGDANNFVEVSVHQCTKMRLKFENWNCTRLKRKSSNFVAN